MINKINLGYPVQNLSTNYRCDRTLQMRDKAGPEIIEKAIALAKENLRDLIEIIKWNHAKNIKLYRISNELFPHIANWRIVSDKMNYRELVYGLDNFASEIAYIGKAAKNQRLTFHASPYMILNSPNHFNVISAMRELWWQTRFFEMAGLPPTSTITVHVGGVYNDRSESLMRFAENFNELPDNIKSRIIIENDETNFCVEDLLKISITPYKAFDREIKKIPICFDIFHYYCWNIYHKKKPGKYQLQKPVEELLPAIKKTWIFRQKMHLSEQKPDAPIGTHSDYITEIPEVLLHLNIDLMLESKCKDITLLQLIEKY